MQLFDFITLGIIAAALIVVIVILVRHFKQLRLLDLDAMPRAKMRMRKYQLIEERLERKTRGLRSMLHRLIDPASNVVAKGIHRAYERLVALEHRYRHAVPQTQTQEEKEKTRQKIATLLESGIQHFQDEKYAEAEGLFLDIIRLNPKEVEAYEYLGEVYLAKKEYDHAVQTLEFAKKLSPQDDRIYCDLGSAYQLQGNMKSAVDHLKQCVKLAPNNPKYLDALLTLAIDARDRLLAKETLKQLREANPENQKIEQFSAAVAEL